MRKVMSLFSCLLLSCCFNIAWAGELKDAESASHVDTAAFPQLVASYDYPGLAVKQFNLAVLSHYSYMLISDGQTLVVDPDRDIDIYLQTALKDNLKIKGVFLTHSHADFVAGHMELVKATGCIIYQNASSGAQYKIEPLKDGSSIELGSALLKFIETPGHTPDGMCALVYSSDDKAAPKLMFTGDTLFVGSVGRPDLMGGTMSAAELASMMFDTWSEKLSKLADSVVVLPAHGAGSLCGANLSDSPSSTVGQERTSNPYLQHKGRGDFIAAVLEGLPDAPQYFKFNAAMNEQGPKLVDWKAPINGIQPDKALMEADKYWVVDMRLAKDYAASHIPNSLNIALRGRLETWVGIMIPWGSDMVMVADNDKDLEEAVFRLHRVGYTGRTLNISAWKSASLPVRQNDTIKPAELYRQMQDASAPVIVDVRLPSEWMGLRIGTVVNLPLNHMAELSDKLDKGQPVVTVCNSAYRSSMAVGVLERKGFKEISSMAGGSEAWIEAGLPVYGSETKANGTAVTEAAKKNIRLPERMAADELARLIKDIPNTYDLVDIRPADQFADYKVSSSVNVDIADLLSNPAYLTGVGPLIIVDRDGSLAMAVAGILSQKSPRQVKALYGGVEAYWRLNELSPAVKALPIAPQPSAPQRMTPAPSTPGQAAPPQPSAPEAPKKKSVGC
jgi:hydroxyacylglutathione hydrolase